MTNERFIGGGISYFRDKKELTGAQLAEMTGLSRSAISMYEKGSRNPSEDSLVKIAEALGVTIKAIMERGETEFSSRQSRVNVENHKYISNNRRRDMVYSNSDLVIELTEDYLLGMRLRLYDLNDDSHPKYFRDRLPSSVESLFANVIREFFREHTDEISDRLYSELDKTNLTVEDIIRGMNHDK